MSSLVHEPPTGQPRVPKGVLGNARDWALSATTRNRITVALMFGLGLALRLHQVAAHGLRTDELYSIWMAGQGIPQMLRAIVFEGRDATPPLYYLLLNLAMHLSSDLWAIRLVTVLSGALLVVVTFYLSHHLFDSRVATMAALLVAIAPFSIEVAQIARAYSLTSLFVLASLYYFLRLRPPTVPRWIVWAYAVLTLLAIATHYLAGIVLVFENLVVLGLVGSGQLPRRKLVGWVKLQTLMALVSLPLLWMAVQRLPNAPAGLGQTWLPAPSPVGLVKTLILWGTGDPSYGGAAFTWPRLVSLIVLLTTLAVGVLTWWRWRQSRADRRIEFQHVLFVAAAFFVPWALAVGISLVRRIFHEKYFVYLSPLLLILLAWVALRARPVRLAQALAIGLLATTCVALGVYYTAPNGEQWREAMALVRNESRAGDYIVTTPAYYIRAVSYYVEGEFVVDDPELMHAPFAVSGPQGHRAAVPAAEGDSDSHVPPLDEVLAQADRVWLVTGFARTEPETLSWFYDNFETLQEHRFLGVTVALTERRSASAVWVPAMSDAR